MGCGKFTHGYGGCTGGGSEVWEIYPQNVRLSEIFPRNMEWEKFTCKMWGVGNFPAKCGEWEIYHQNVGCGKFPHKMWGVGNFPTKCGVWKIYPQNVGCGKLSLKSFPLTMPLSNAGTLGIGTEKAFFKPN